MGCRAYMAAIAQGDATLYVGVMPAGQVLRHATVDYWAPGTATGYQRPLVAKRVREVANYLVEGRAVMPTSIVLSVRHDGDLAFQPQDASSGTRWGLVAIGEGAQLWVVDGQHRLEGLRHAIEDGHGDLSEFQLPTTILVGATPLDELVLFYTINTKQRRIPSDIINQHLAILKRRYGEEFVTEFGISAELRARASTIVDHLNEMEGPWRGKVMVPGVPGREAGLVRHNTLVASLRDVLADPALNAYSEQSVAALLIGYWEALRRLMPDAFQTPGDYTVQAATGIYAFHIVFRRVFDLARKAKRTDSETMERALRYAGEFVTSRFWHRVHGNDMARATGMQSIRNLAARIVGKLPGPDLLSC